MVMSNTLLTAMLLEVHKRFSSGANFGEVTTEFYTRKGALIMQHVTEELSTISMNEAAQKETDNGQIDIEIDATYSARRNANCSNTFALGVKSHQIIGAEILCKQDEAIPQRHEMVATERIIRKLQSKGIKFKNNQVSKVIATNVLSENTNESDRENVEQNDIWYVIKSDMAKFTILTKGTKKTENVTWSN